KRMMTGDEEAGRPLGDALALHGASKFPVPIKCALLSWAALARTLDQLPGSAPAPSPGPLDSAVHRVVLSVRRAGRLRAGAAGLAVGQQLLLVLQLIQPPVQAPLLQQLLVRAHLPNLALVQHDDVVRVLDRRQPVRDDDAGAVFDELLQRF